MGSKSACEQDETLLFTEFSNIKKRRTLEINVIIYSNGIHVNYSGNEVQMRK